MWVFIQQYVEELFIDPTSLNLHLLTPAGGDKPQQMKQSNPSTSSDYKYYKAVMKITDTSPVCCAVTVMFPSS